MKKNLMVVIAIVCLVSISQLKAQDKDESTQVLQVVFKDTVHAEQPTPFHIKSRFVLASLRLGPVIEVCQEHGTVEHGAYEYHEDSDTKFPSYQVVFSQKHVGEEVTLSCMAFYSVKVEGSDSTAYLKQMQKISWSTFVLPSLEKWGKEDSVSCNIKPVTLITGYPNQKLGYQVSSIFGLRLIRVTAGGKVVYNEVVKRILGDFLNGSVFTVEIAPPKDSVFIVTTQVLTNSRIQVFNDTLRVVKNQKPQVGIEFKNVYIYGDSNVRFTWADPERESMTGKYYIYSSTDNNYNRGEYVFMDGKTRDFEGNGSWDVLNDLPPGLYAANISTTDKGGAHTDSSATFTVRGAGPLQVVAPLAFPDWSQVSFMGSEDLGWISAGWALNSLGFRAPKWSGTVRLFGSINTSNGDAYIEGELASDFGDNYYSELHYPEGWGFSVDGWSNDDPNGELGVYALYGKGRFAPFAGLVLRFEEAPFETYLDAMRVIPSAGFSFSFGNYGIVETKYTYFTNDFPFKQRVLESRRHEIGLRYLVKAMNRLTLGAYVPFTFERGNIHDLFPAYNPLPDYIFDVNLQISRNFSFTAKRVKGGVMHLPPWQAGFAYSWD